MTTAATDYWLTRHDTFGPGWCDHYWNADRQPHRDILINELSQLPPFETLLEVGCNVGTNLRRVVAALPNVRPFGIDINTTALAYGHARFDAGFVCADLHALPLRDDSVDVIVSCYALAYVAPRLIEPVLSLLKRACRVGLVVVEPFGIGVFHDRHEWQHLYDAHLPGCIVHPIEPPVDQYLNAAIRWVKP